MGRGQLAADSGHHTQHAGGYVKIIVGEINAGLRELLSEKAGKTKIREG
jgi:hypothetical protein